jgi:aromatic ring-cleaving dioxygenase
MSLGPVEIDEHEFEARFIRIRNTSNTDVAIGQWILRRVADHRQVEYEFDSSAIIKAGQQIVVWSANQSDGVIQNPTNGDYVMDARWLAGKSMATTLLDEKGIVSCHRIIYFLIFKVTKYF